MASKIILKKSSVANKVPVAGDLDFGELAINYTDGKLYFKDASNAITFFQSGGGSGSSNLAPSDVAPSSPVNGQPWWDSTQGRLYIYYDDGNTSQWVDASPGVAGPQGPAATIAVGTVTTGSPGSNAVVTNAGTSSAAVFNFTIPQGPQGLQGPEGPAGGVSTVAGTANQITVSAPTGNITLSLPSTINVNTSGSAASANSATAKWTSAAIAGSTTTGGVVSAEFKNNGGTGDSNMAAIAFHCTGTYATHMHLRADGYFGVGGWSASAWRWYINLNNGDMTTAGNVTAYSDETLKTNWRNYPVDFVDQLAKVKNGTYDRIDEDLTQDGVSAQSLQKLLPNSVVKSNGILSVNYGGAALTSSVELAKRIVEQDKKIKKLEELVSQLLNKEYK